MGSYSVSTSQTAYERPKRKAVEIANKADPCALQIGSLKLNGFRSIHGVANFLNIPYAQIPARFRTALPVNPSALHGGLDAADYGPRCPQPTDPIHVVMGHMFERQSMDQYSSEFDCLHLNIYTPADFHQLPESRKLPVFAYIHGGAFNCGDNTTEFDGNHLVRRSIDLGIPIVVVAINYRLNLLGFLSSHELIAEAKAAGEIPVRNQGLNDQKLALQWIRSNIDHFGGNPLKVTASGESAGAASVLFQLKGNAPLFNQAIIQSTPFPRLRTLDEAQHVFDGLVCSAGVSLSAPYQVKLAALRSLSAHELIDSWNGSFPSYPIEDPDWFDQYDAQQANGPHYWADVPLWCERVIIGHTKDEAALFFAPRLSDLSQATLDRILHSLDPHPELGAAILESTVFKSAPSPLRALVAYGTLSVFQRPVMDLAHSMAEQGKQVWVYELGITDPFDGPLQGFAWHSFGVPIMFYQPSCKKNVELRITADKTTSAYVGFFYGYEPWESFNVSRRKWLWDGAASDLVEPSDITDEPLTILSSSPELRTVYLEQRSKLLERIAQNIQSIIIEEPTARSTCL